MFDEVLIESAGRVVKKNTWVTAGISGIVHMIVIGALVAAGMVVKENPEVIEKPMNAFIVAAAPPPPPPPPPASGGPERLRTQVAVQREPRRDVFTQPRDVPRDIPVVDVPAADDAENADDGGVPEGVPGGVKGGKIGGVLGGDLEHGVLGGDLTGKPGGQVGGSVPADRPVYVGGNVKAPIAVKRVDPVYPEVARKARVQGIVIIEAVIDREGNVTDARVLKPLPFGLDVAALNAVRQWKFKPGTLNGEPVPVYYNLTVNFRIE